jgi:[ribosomal protein S5]-alanine N-acetyltransferase
MRTIVETERLRLREMTEDDAENLFRLSANPNVIRYVGEPPLASIDDALTILRTRVFPQYASYGVGRWAVELTEGASFIGWCGLKYLAEANEYDLGYRLFEERWGHGYATEAARGVLEWSRRQLPHARIIAVARVENGASRRVLEKLGFIYESETREPDGVLARYVLRS